MYSDEELKDFAIKILQYIETNYNFKDVEVFVQSISKMQGGTEFRTPKSFQSVHRVGCAIRFFEEKKLYFSCFSLPNTITELDNNIKINRFPIQANYFEFPEIKKPSKGVSNIYDKNIASLDLEKIKDFSVELRKIEKEMDHLILDASILMTKERRIIANSTHSFAYEKGTWCNIDLRALYRGYNMISSGESHYISRIIPGSIRDMVDVLISDTIQRSSKKVKITNLLLPVIFSPSAFANLLSFVLVPNLSTEKSNRIANMSFSEDFTLIDDGTVPGLPNSTAFDDEGVLQSKTVVFEKGILKNTLNNSELQKPSEEKTGNSFRIKMYELFPRNYQAYPGIYPSNMIIKEGTRSFGDIVSEFGEGIFVNSLQGYMTADSISGSFSVSTIDSYLIENGSIAGTLPSFDITGNLFSILQNEPIFTSDRKVVRPYNTPYSFVVPYLVTENVTIFT
ncbi:MAG: metallopeptidase TldD-related protein [Candidatus Heimdallarchaeaceae archaeon]